jgi:hypothetical protein
MAFIMAFSQLQWLLGEGWWINPTFILFFSMCFAGMAAWEAALLLGQRSRLLIIVLAFLVLIPAIALYYIFPVDPRFVEWVPGRIPIFTAMLLELVLFCGFVIDGYAEQGSIPRINLFSAILITVIWVLLSSVPSQFAWDVTDYGQMVSFFVLVVPVVLLWEGLIKGYSSAGWSDARFLLTLIGIILISLFIGFLAVSMGGLQAIS